MEPNYEVQAYERYRDYIKSEYGTHCVWPLGHFKVLAYTDYLLQHDFPNITAELRALFVYCAKLEKTEPVSNKSHNEQLTQARHRQSDQHSKVVRLKGIPCHC